MWEASLKKHLDSETDRLIQHFNSSRNQYVEIWNFYREHMPICIKECSEAKKNYPEVPDREGPQGIYWIGRNPQVLFVGREHFGWYGEAAWPDDTETICYSPLQFSFYTVESMGSYWAKIQDIMNYLFDQKEYTWDDKLQQVAFSNACKCLSYNPTYQWNLHENCLKHRYLSQEIATIGAKVSVLFTKSHPIMDRLFDSETEIISRDAEFPARRRGTKIIIECAHPGRQTVEWQDRLKKAIKEGIDA